MQTVRTIIESNNFGKIEETAGLGQDLREVLNYYTIERE